jgi:HAE1 family hydrophobic/amphiphilic exporter-1
VQKLAEICIRRPVFATMIVLSLVVVGAAGFFRLGVDRFPSVDLPTVSVRVGLPGAAPEEVESLITQQVEDVVNTVDGISELRSVSGQGTSIVILNRLRRTCAIESTRSAGDCLKMLHRRSSRSLITTAHLF